MGLLTAMMDHRNQPANHHTVPSSSSFLTISFSVRVPHRHKTAMKFLLSCVCVSCISVLFLSRVSKNVKPILENQILSSSNWQLLHKKSLALLGVQVECLALPRYFFSLPSCLFSSLFFLVDKYTHTKGEPTDALNVCPEVGGIRKPRPFFCTEYVCATTRQQTSHQTKIPSTRDFPIPSSSAQRVHTLSDRWCIFWFVNSFQITWEDCHVVAPWLINGHTNEYMAKEQKLDDDWEIIHVRLYHLCVV